MRVVSQAVTRRASACSAALALLALVPSCAGRAARGQNQGAPGTPGDGRVRWVGRVLENAGTPGAGRFAWMGAGLVATVRGTRIDALIASDWGNEIFFQPVVDGKALPRFSVLAPAGEEIPVAAGLSEGDHVVELYRETESHQGPSTFLGFTQGVVEGAPPPGERLLEIVGDSISTGYGNLGHETHSSQGSTGECTWSAATSSWAQSYGALAGHALGAEVSTIAVSGWGLYEDGSDDRDHVLGKVYGHALGVDDPTPWTFARAPQAVVVHLGSNDVGPLGNRTFDVALYVRAGLELVSQIRAHAPDAWIFFAIGPRLDEQAAAMVREGQQAIVDQRRGAGDERIDRLDLPGQPAGPQGEIETGCQWHPSLGDHQLMAETLRQRLHERLGW